MLNQVLFALILLVTCTVEGITGFGGGILALPFLDPLVGLKSAVPALATLGLINSSYRTVTMYKQIVKKELWTMVFFIVLGLPVGMWAFDVLPERPLKIILGVFMLYVAIKGLVEIYQPHLKAQASQPASGKRKILFYVLLFCGGIMQGAFTSGGPFIVMYATMALKEKEAFRATLFAMWVVVNTIITARNAVSGVLTVEVLQLVLWALPALLFSVLISNRLQKYISGQTFNKIVYGTLLIAGLFMCVNH